MASEATTTEVAIRDDTSAVILTNAQLQMIANTSFVPAAFRGKVPEVLACVATGRALGLPDMTSLRGIHVIEGKATLSAELMVAIVRSHGHSITGSVDDEKAVAKGKRVDNGDTFDVTFSLKMAETAGLLGKSNWKKHPDDMMWARAVSKLCRRLFADCFAGATYVPEEVGPTADELFDVEDSAAPDTGPVAAAREPEAASAVAAGAAETRDEGQVALAAEVDALKDRLEMLGKDTPRKVKATLDAMPDGLEAQAEYLREKLERAQAVVA